jgi:hypothetical protein
VLALLERGTLLLENVHRLAPGDRDRLVQYIQTGTVQPMGISPPSPPPSGWCWLAPRRWTGGRDSAPSTPSSSLA